VRRLLAGVGARIDDGVVAMVVASRLADPSVTAAEVAQLRALAGASGRHL
jgi:hypothetical protein